MLICTLIHKHVAVTLLLIDVRTISKISVVTPIMLGSYWTKHDINYPIFILDMAVKLTYKYLENRLDNFGIHREQQCDTRIICNRLHLI